MNLLFKTESEFLLDWIGWQDLPAATILIKNADFKNKNFKTLFNCIEQGMQRLFVTGHHRAFIFFKDDQFEVAQELVEWAKSNQSQIEIFVEVCRPIEDVSKFNYLGLRDYFNSYNSGKFLVLSVAPTRFKQAQRLQVYLEQEKGSL